MLNGVKAAVRQWLGGSAHPPGPAPGPVKAPRSATLTTYLGNPIGPSTPQWSDVDTMRYHTGWVYASARAIAQRIAGQGVRVGRRTPSGPVKGHGRATKGPRSGREEPESGRRWGYKGAADGPPWLRPGVVKELTTHPLLDSFDDPNPFLTSFDLLDLAVRSLLLTGLAYLWLDEQPDGSTRVWYLPSGWVREDPDAKVPLSRFIVRPAHSVQEFPLDASELVRFALPDPANPLAGLGLLKAGFFAVQTDQEIQTAQLATLRNSARPGLLVKINQETTAGGIPGTRPVLNNAQRRALASRISAAYAGTLRAGEPLILDGFIEDVKPLFDGESEVDYRDSSALTKERITQLFGCNPIILGQVEGANRASAVVADENFCYATCKPIAVKLGQTLTKWFRVHHDDPNLVVWVPPPEPRDPDGRRADLDQLARAGGITVNELRAEHGLPPIAGGDVLVKAPPSPAPAGGSPTPADGKASDPGAGLIEPGWGKGADLWQHLDTNEKLAVYRRHHAARGGYKAVRG